MVQIIMRDLKKVSALRNVRFRVSILERFCYKGFLRNLSRTKCFVHLREVSALEDVRFREVPLYLVSPKSLKHKFCQVRKMIILKKEHSEFVLMIYIQCH